MLGVGVVGPGAGELIAEGALAVETAALAEDLAATIHAHPTLSETFMEAAQSLLLDRRPISIGLLHPRRYECALGAGPRLNAVLARARARACLGIRSPRPRLRLAHPKYASPLPSGAASQLDLF